MTTYVEPLIGKMPIPAPMRARVTRAAADFLNRGQRQFDVTLVASEMMRRRLIDRDVTNVWTVPFGVEPALFAIGRTRPPRRQARRLLYAGRLDADKEIHLLQDALPQILAIRGVHVTVVGKGRAYAHFAAIAHPRFRCEPYIGDRHALHQLYADHDVLLAPRRFETFGLSTLEAMAAGLAVVGPGAGGTGELLRQAASPFIFAAGDRASFVARTAEAAEADLRPVIARGGDTARAHGTWHDAVSRQVAVYERVMGARGAA
jgi:hypothetical protein